VERTLNDDPLSDEDRATVWGKVTGIQQSLNRAGFGLNVNTAIALRVVAMICEVPMERREDMDLDVDTLISVAYAEQAIVNKEH
jgi:hypothetical protein